MRAKTLVILLLTVLTAGCGGGGGGGASATHTATVTLSTAGTPANSQIGDVDITLNLPAGVTIASVAGGAGQIPAPGVVTLKGTAATAASQSVLSASYLPGPPAQVKLTLISNGGLPVGDQLMTVVCNIATGSTPLPTDFSFTPNIAPTGVFDLTTAALPNVQVNLSAVIN